MPLDVLIEAMLFYKATPLKKASLRKLFEVSETDFSTALEQLRHRLEFGATRLVETETEVSLATAPELSEFVESLRKAELKGDIGKAGAETLSIILYREPISRAEIDRIRGVNSSFILRNLLVKGLIAREAVGNSYQFRITPDLLKHLGVSTKQELPRFSEFMTAIDSFNPERMKDDEKILGNRRIVIVFQLLLLLLILSGLFGAFILDKKQTASVTEAIPLSEAPLSAANPDVLAELREVEVRAKAAYVWDVARGEALYAKNEEAVLPLASITKLMTSLLAYELAAADTTTKLSSRAANQEGSSLAAGEQFTLDELNRLALISSSNSAAYELSASVGALLGDRDPSAQFVEGMNIKAEELGFKTFSFKNPTGLDISQTEPGAVGSAKDVSLLMEHILKEYPELLEATTRGGARIYNSNGEYHDVENTNEVLYAIPNLIGSKTGYTDLAGGNLTVAFDAGMNRPVIITVLGSTREERFSDVLRLVRATQSHISDL